jgi:uncharacterized protein
VIRAVIDTNCLIASIPKSSNAHWLYLAFSQRKFVWVLSNEIVTEYVEIVGDFYSHAASEVVVNRLLISENIELREPYFRWNLVENDPDDNKFADLALAANVDFLVSNDKHLLRLKELTFPPIPVVSLEEFKVALGL